MLLLQIASFIEKRFMNGYIKDVLTDLWGLPSIDTRVPFVILINFL